MMEQISIRAAKEADIGALCRLLEQVCSTHADIRPDIFRAGAKKYTQAELSGILKDANTPVFVATIKENVAGYIFCMMQKAGNATKQNTLYVDDLCVDASIRGKGIGKKLFDYACAYAKEQGCYNVTLHVWAGNESAEAFYAKQGMQTQKTCLEKIL